MTAGLGDWEGVLDRFAERLDLVDQAALAGKAGDVPAFDPPVDLGPLPAALRPRARALLVRALGLEARLQQAADDTAAQVVAARRAARGAGSIEAPRPRLVDRTL